MPSAAYNAQANSATKRLQYLIEIELDRCSRVYTQAPCTAVDQGDGARCHYSFSTCQDPPNYDRTTRVYRFCLHDVPWCDPNVQVYPLLEKLVSVPQKIDPDRLSTFPEQLRFMMLRDFAPPQSDHDKGAGFHNTARVGEFWANLLARNPNYAGRPVRLYQGFYVEAGFALTDFERVGPEYKLRGIEARRESIAVTVESSLADMDKRQIPFTVSDDNLLLNAGGANSVATVLDVVDASEYPDPAEYVRNRIYVEIESEILEVTTRNVGADQLTVVRGQFGTLASSHAQGSAVRHVVCFGDPDGVGQPGNVVSFIQDLLEWAGVVAADIDTASFDLVELVAWSGSDGVRVLRSPKKVAKLVQEIRDTRGILTYISTAGKWAAHVFGPAVATLLVDDTHCLDDSVEVEQDDEERITRVLYYWDPVDDGSSQSSDFGRVVAVINATLESANNFGEPRDRTVTDPWLGPLTPISTVRNIARRTITRLRLGTRRVRFQLETRDATGLSVGDARVFRSSRLTGVSGELLSRPMLVTSKKDVRRGLVAYEAIDTAFSGPFLRMGPDTMADTYATATEDDKLYGYWGDADNRVGVTNVPGYVYY